MAKYKGPVCCSNETIPPGHYAVGEDGAPDGTKRLKWVDANDDPDDSTGHWETNPMTDDELQAAATDLKQRLVQLRAQAKGEGASNGG